MMACPVLGLQTTPLVSAGMGVAFDTSLRPPPLSPPPPPPTRSIIDLALNRGLQLFFLSSSIPPPLLGGAAAASNTCILLAIMEPGRTRRPVFGLLHTSPESIERSSRSLSKVGAAGGAAKQLGLSRQQCEAPEAGSQEINKRQRLFHSAVRFTICAAKTPPNPGIQQQSSKVARHSNMTRKHTHYLLLHIS